MTLPERVFIRLVTIRGFTDVGVVTGACILVYCIGQGRSSGCHLGLSPQHVEDVGGFFTGVFQLQFLIMCMGISFAFSNYFGSPLSIALNTYTVTRK